MLLLWIKACRPYTHSSYGSANSLSGLSGSKDKFERRASISSADPTSVRRQGSALCCLQHLPNPTNSEGSKHGRLGTPTLPLSNTSLLSLVQQAAFGSTGMILVPVKRAQEKTEAALRRAASNQHQTEAPDSPSSCTSSNESKSIIPLK